MRKGAPKRAKEKKGKMVAPIKEPRMAWYVVAVYLSRTVSIGNDHNLIPFLSKVELC